jgi:hypothetical protein
MVFLGLSTEGLGRSHRREMYIPSEIMLMITEYLAKKDWKSLRLVSRGFYTFMINVPLFTELWFSTHAEDLEVFNGVCNHPSLGKHVMTIFYDYTRFPELSTKEFRSKSPKPLSYRKHFKSRLRQLTRLLCGESRESRERFFFHEWVENRPVAQGFLNRFQHQNSVDEAKF